jgi:hypothetical protein
MATRSATADSVIDCVTTTRQSVANRERAVRRKIFSGVSIPADMSTGRLVAMSMGDRSSMNGAIVGS